MLKLVALYKVTTAISTVRTTSCRLILNRSMSWVSVRKIAGEERLQMSFKFGVGNGTDSDTDSQNGIGRVKSNGRNGGERLFNMDRLQDETLEKTIARIQANVSKVLNKKNKKKRKKNNGAAADTESTQESSASEEDTVDIHLCNPDGQVVNPSLPNSEVWQEGAVLVIGEKKLTVRVNVPVIKEMILPNCIMAGFEMFPVLDAEFIDLTHCKFVWFKEEKEHGIEKEPSTETESESGSPTAKKPCTSEENVNWVKIGEGPSYMPVNADINCRLKLECTPRNEHHEGETKVSVSKYAVTAGPGFCPFENRHLETQHQSGNGNFRVLTYNILANTYADSEFSRDMLYPYCPPYALEQDYRKHLIIKELLGYNSDIICLQEVDRRLFMSDLLPAFELQGFEGFLKLKVGQVMEGTATFYRKSKFRLLGQHDIAMTESLKELPIFADVWEKICTNEVFKNKMDERTSSFQVTVLESTESPARRVVVGTSHFYFHPRAPHVRVIQAITCLRHLQAVVDLYSNEESEKPSIVFCGDLNSYPEAGVHSYLRDKYIPSNHADWYGGGKEEFLEDMTFFHTTDLISACGYPRYTNYVSSFSGCLDYIYVEKNRLKPVKVVSMPTHEEVTQYTAIPNAVFPSDHIALICDVAWI